MKKKHLIGGAFALMVLGALNKKPPTTSSKVIYADVKEPAPNDHTHSDGGPGGGHTPV